MKAKLSLYASVVLMIVALGLSACTRARSDSQIATDVQGKIAADSNLPNKNITVQSANGVVTLSGNVGSDVERSAAANDAAQIPGVKTVVNNLQVNSAAATPQPQPAAEQQPEQQEEQPATTASSRRSRRRETPRRDTARTNPAETRGPGGAFPSSASNNGTSTTADNSSAVNIPTPAVIPHQPPQPVTVPDGTQLTVRLLDALDSAQNHDGDTFHATVDSPITVDEKTAIPSGADVEGRVVSTKAAGKFAGKPELVLELTKISMNGRDYNLQTDQWSKSGPSRGARTAKTTAGGAAVGAILGGIFGGGKGAAIGAAAGAGAGAGVEGVTKAQQVHLPAETSLSFRLQSPITVTPSATSHVMPSGRPRLERRSQPNQPPADSSEPQE
jgi:hypothetical protein